jgi:transposase
VIVYWFGMDAEHLRDEIRAGRIDVDRLIDLIEMQQKQLQDAQRRIEELEKQLGRKASQKLDAPFSMRAEEQRQGASGKPGRRPDKASRRGRGTTADKIAKAARRKAVYPEGVPRADCRLSHTRVAWRLENGRAVLVAYDVYRGPGNRYGMIPGVFGRSEFGIEIVIAIAYQVYVVGLSFDKVCLLMNFFQNLTLRKSQADALLNQLARQWAGEFDNLCRLLANSAVVHADETGWSIRSVWAFLSEKVRVLFFGVHKDAATLEQILNPATFGGIVISDDAAVYANFTHSQKCWAHLLRKAIKLTLLEPGHTGYREFTDRLLEIYREACRVKNDRRFGDAGRAAKVTELDDEILRLCGGVWFADLPRTDGAENDFRLLVNEVMRLMLNRQLFTFVTAAVAVSPSGETLPVPGTNNEAERTLRGSAQARVTGRTNKTIRGARRQTIVLSVLESLRCHLQSFTLTHVIDEILKWRTTGESCFSALIRRLQLPPPTASCLDGIYPPPAQ